MESCSLKKMVGIIMMIMMIITTPHIDRRLTMCQFMFKVHDTSLLIQSLQLEEVNLWIL